MVDTAANSGAGSFSTINFSGVVGTSKWVGAAVVGTKVYFAPLEADKIGVVDTAVNSGAGSFSTIDYSGVGDWHI